jgi:hypothetical protein
VKQADVSYCIRIPKSVKEGDSKMSYDDGVLKIKKCPLCSSSHDYNFRREIKPLAIPISPGYEVDDYWARVEVSFECPGKKEEFVSEVAVPHRVNERILKVDTKPVEA